MTHRGKDRPTPLDTHKLKIGRDQNGRAFTIPAEFVTLTSAILGVRGSGKTTTAKVCVEEMHKADLQVAIIDPLDVWWGVRSSADGKQPGLSIIVLGGEHGDLPLEATSGAVVADFLVETGASLLLSVRHLSKKDQRRLVTDFSERLYRRKGETKHRTPLHVAIDEADAFAPQRIPPDGARCFGAVDDLVRRGRANGIGVTLITQRSAALNKDVLTQIETLIAMRTLSPHDRKAIEAWVDVHDAEGVADQVMSTLHKLGRGEAWVWSPAWLRVLKRIKVRRPETFDSSATPKLGQRARAPKRLADVDLDALRRSMADTLKKAEQDNPALLRRQIAELKSQARRQKPAERVVEVPALTRQDRDLLAKAAGGVQAAGQRLCKDLSGLLDRLDGALAGIQRQVRAPRSAATVRAASQPAKPPPARPRAAPEATTIAEGELVKADRLILTALAQHGPSTKFKTAIVTRYSAKSGSFSNAISRCRVQGWLDGDNKGELSITDAGLAILGVWEPLPTGPALIGYWQAWLAKAPREILQVLVDNYPHTLTKEQIAEQTASCYSATSGSFSNSISRLRTLGLAIGHGEIRASDDLFT